MSSHNRFTSGLKRLRRSAAYHDPTGDIAAARVDREREQIELDVITGMATQSLLSRHATNEQCADMVRGLAPWWDIDPHGGLSRGVWRITDHAATRAAEMGLDPDTITAILATPEERRVQGEMSAYTGDVLYLWGDYAAAIARDTFPRVVITFLYRYQDGYEAQYDAPSEGRERRTSHLPRKAA